MARRFENLLDARSIHRHFQFVAAAHDQLRRIIPGSGKLDRETGHDAGRGAVGRGLIRFVQCNVHLVRNQLRNHLVERRGRIRVHERRKIQIDGLYFLYA